MTTAELFARYNAVADQHPGEVGIIGESVNEYGTPVSVLRCKDCGKVVSVCPPIPEERHSEWLRCFGEGCLSYDLDRDIDIFWDALSDNDMIRREDA